MFRIQRRRRSKSPEEFYTQTLDFFKNEEEFSHFCFTFFPPAAAAVVVFV